MNKKKHLFLFSLIVLSALSLFVMNVKYDRLSRYPYQEEEARRIIDEHLTDEEIEYIIEYSIAPNVFVPFIDVDSFNIYHAAEYKKLSLLRWQLSPDDIVHFVEKTRNYIDVETLNEYLYNYSFEELLYILENGDPYNEESLICANAGSSIAYVDSTYFIGRREPKNLVYVDNDVIELAKNIQLEEVCKNALSNMCEAISSDENFKHLKCGGLLLEEGYVSYDEQVEIYNDVVNGNSSTLNVSYPGHSEHQLGLAVDFSVIGLDKVNFDRTIQSEWLDNHAHNFGFVKTYTVQSAVDTLLNARSYHYRYVGVNAATIMKNQGLTLKQIVEQQ